MCGVLARSPSSVGGRTRVDGVARTHPRARSASAWRSGPAHADELDDLLEAADEAMYRAKRDGTATAIAQPRPSDPADLLVAT